MWKILDKGISECKACGRKKPTTSATRARLSWKGIVTHNGGGSSAWSFIISVTSWLFCKFDTCSASLWTTKLFPTPGWSEVTTWTFKLKKQNIWNTVPNYFIPNEVIWKNAFQRINAIYTLYFLQFIYFYNLYLGKVYALSGKLMALPRDIVKNKPTLVLDQLLQLLSKTHAVHSTTQASDLVPWTGSLGNVSVLLTEVILACQLCTVLRRSLYELVLRFHCYIGQQERGLETSKMKHLLTKKYILSVSASENELLMVELMNLVW